MNLETFFEKFDLFADAPNAVAKMRELVLQLAMQGRLVEQDPNDEPAEDLLARIEKAKERLINKREIKKVSLDPNPTVDEGDPLPTGWLWTRLGAAFDIRDGTHDTPKYTHEGVPLITSKNIYTGSLSFEGANFISDEDHRQICKRSRVDRGDILFAMIGSIGNPVLVDTDREFSIKNVALFKYYRPDEPEPRFLLQYLKLVSEQMRAIAAGGVQSFVSLGFLRNYPVPLPPLAEQKRILAKVDELIASCDRLEAQQQEREARHAVLARASLARFADAPTPANLNFIFHKSYDIAPADLRKTTLTLAYHGMLVSQKPDEGTGNDLLRRMGSLQPDFRAFRGGKRKNESKLDPLDCSGIFPVPISWRWSYLDFVCERIADVDHNMPKAVSNGVPFISAKDLKDDGTIDFSTPKMISEEDYGRLSRKLQPRRDDIIYSRIGAKLGKARLVTVDTRFLISYSCCLVRPLQNIVDTQYLQRFLDSHLALNQARKGTQSIGVPDLGLGEIRAFRIPIPPLTEQRRIMAKVDELMALVNTLETELNTARTTADKLMEAIVAELTSSGVTYAAIRNDFPDLSADQPNILYRTESPGAA